LWAFATLGHTPEGLLKGLKVNWEWRLAKGRKMPRGMKTKGTAIEITYCCMPIVIV
jgi:hypothetical protein